MDIELYKKHIKFEPKEHEEEQNCNYKLCASCTHKCCDNMGCEISPYDLDEVTVESITDLLNSGIVSIDAWEEIDGRTYYLRMRNKDKGLVDYPWSSTPCILLKDDGCPFEYKYRGKGGREVIPSNTTFNCSCKTKYSKEDCKIEWENFQNVILDTVNKLDIDLSGDEDYIPDPLNILGMMLGRFM